MDATSSRARVVKPEFNAFATLRMKRTIAPLAKPAAGSLPTGLFRDCFAKTGHELSRNLSCLHRKGLRASRSMGDMRAQILSCLFESKSKPKSKSKRDLSALVCGRPQRNGRNDGLDMMAMAEC